MSGIKWGGFSIIGLLNNISKINQLQMYISQLLPKSPGSKTALLTSIIEPDSRNTDKNIEFLTKKIPLADKTLIKEYKERAAREHPNVPQLFITQNSDFYMTVHLQKSHHFDPRDLIKIPFNKRAKLLADILRAATFLSQQHGYFYLTPRMLQYRSDGDIMAWISEDYLANRPQYPINHGRLSEEIFVADFKETFGGNFQEMKEFRKAKNLSSLLKILNRGEDIYRSLLMSEPVSKESLIYRDQTLKFSNVLNSKDDLDGGKKLQRGLKHAESMNSIIINVNNENYGQFQEKQKTLTRTLSSPSSIKMTSFNSVSKLKDNERSAYGSLTSQNLPTIHFTYSSKDAWKKKPNEPEMEPYYSSLKIRPSYGQQSSVRESSKELLKVSFPYTTTHSFSPLASFGSINLNSAAQQAIQDPERPLQTKKADQTRMETGMQEIGEMQLQFQNLFQSNLMQSDEELENLSVIMEEFECILQG